MCLLCWGRWHFIWKAIPSRQNNEVYQALTNNQLNTITQSWWHKIDTIGLTFKSDLLWMSFLTVIKHRIFPSRSWIWSIKNNALMFLNKGAEGVTSNNSFPIYRYMNYLQYSSTGSNLRQVTQLGAALLCWVRTYGVVTTRMELAGFPFSGQLHHRGKMGFPWLHWVLLERSAMDPHGWQ